MPFVLVGPTRPSRCRRCMVVFTPVGLRAPSGPSWLQTSGSPTVVPSFVFLWWNQWLCQDETGELRDKQVWARQENEQSKSFPHVHDKTTQHDVEMNMSFGYDFGQGWSAEERCNGSVSDAPQPSELATSSSLASTVLPAEVETAYDARFLLTFFSFQFAKLGIGKPQWLIGMRQTYWPLCQYAFCVVFPQTTPMLLHDPNKLFRLAPKSRMNGTTSNSIQLARDTDGCNICTKGCPNGLSGHGRPMLKSMSDLCKYWNFVRKRAPTICGVCMVIYTYSNVTPFQVS